MERVRRFAELDQQKADLKSMIKELDVELTILDERIQNDMTQSGITQHRVEVPRGSGKHRTVHLRRDLRASPTDIGALARYADTAEFVKLAVNAQTLSAFVREITELNKDGLPILPEQIKDAVKVSEIYSVRSRKA